MQDNEEKVIAYASKTLTPEEIKYCVTRLELLAINISRSELTMVPSNTLVGLKNLKANWQGGLTFYSNLISRY